MVKINNGNNNGNGHKRLSFLEKASFKFTDWVGTPTSLIVHSAFFIGIFVLSYFGLTTDKILLILTTAVSLEAIYLSIFIQMSVNRATESIEEVGEDIEDIQEETMGEEEANKVIIHIGQQMKVIQQDLDALKKSGLLKSSNGHRVHV